MDTSKRTCVFCGGGPLTKEHVFRSALSKRFEQQPGNRYRQSFTGEKRPALKSMFDNTVRRACAACNNGWMNDLEIEVETPLDFLLSGHEIAIPSKLTIAIARWCVKTALMRGFIESRPTVRLEDCEEIRLVSAVPNHWRVICARVPPWTPTSDRYSHLVVEEEESGECVNLQQMTLVLGRVCFVAIGCWSEPGGSKVSQDLCLSIVEPQLSFGFQILGAPLRWSDQTPNVATREVGLVSSAVLRFGAQVYGSPLPNDVPVDRWPPVTLAELPLGLADLL